MINKSLNFGRDIIISWVRKHSLKNMNILDIGCGAGTDLINISKSCPDKNISLFGIELDNPSIIKAQNHGIKVSKIDIEKNSFPFDRSVFDLIIANQIIEHTKEIFWIFSEISRVLKPKALCIVGVPNLASLHNRLLLLLGKQPTCIHLLGPHVRGITKPSLVEFITKDGYFRIIEVKGANFYPFPELIAKPLSKLLPTFSVCIFFLIERTEKTGNFVNVLKRVNFATPYFTGKS